MAAIMRKHYNLYIGAIVLADLLLSLFIVHWTSYTEIDWRAYMQQVTSYLAGERNYALIKSATGPLVYPAAFVYIYTALYKLTDQGTDIRLAQYIFVGLYVSTLFIVLQIYRRANIHPFVLVLLCASRRLHSIYMLRLFNDCFAMAFAFLAIHSMVRRKPLLSTVLFSLATAIKMNILLFVPAHLYILVMSNTALHFFRHIFVFLGIQIVVGAPFLFTYLQEYLSAAFDLNRTFMYIWTVNWKMIPEKVFVAQWWGITLLVLWVSSCLVFLIMRLQFHDNGNLKDCLKTFFTGGIMKDAHRWTVDDIVFLYFAINLIGITFSRTLHFQFYSWYYWTLPYLFTKTSMTWPTRLALLATIEICWNIFPSTPVFSTVLFVCHLQLLARIMPWKTIGYSVSNFNEINISIVQRLSSLDGYKDPLMISSVSSQDKFSQHETNRSSQTTMRRPNRPPKAII